MNAGFTPTRNWYVCPFSFIESASSTLWGFPYVDWANVHMQPPSLPRFMAQDNVTGEGTTTTVLLIGESLMLVGFFISGRLNCRSSREINIKL